MRYENATIWTGDPVRPWAEAMWVREGRIRSVGSRAEVAAAAGTGVPGVDLRGAFLCPGLIDAHAHVLGFGLGLDRVDLVGATTLAEALGRVQRRVAERTERGESGWLRGRGWDQNDWTDARRFPTRQHLDAIPGNAAIALTRIDGHAFWVNTRALTLAGIGPDTPDPEGGRILRDAEGRPTGILIDTAMALVRDVIPPADDDTKRDAIRRAVEALARAGMTGVHDMGMSVRERALYTELARAGELPVRIFGALSATDPGRAAEVVGGPDRDWHAGTFKLGMVKIYMDGALGSRGAALLEPYTDEAGNRGLLITDDDELRALLDETLSHGFQAAVHAIGDRANRMVLDAWADVHAAVAPVPAPAAPPSLLGEVPAERPRVRIEHAQIVHPEDLARFGELGVVASMQPTHCTSDMPWAGERLGQDRLTGTYAWRSIIDAGGLLAAGSDFPVEDHRPLLGLYAAVTRRGIDGEPPGGWSPEERLGRSEALAVFTAAPAYASGDLHRFGTLTPGKEADFVVFDRNLITADPVELLGARALLTVVAGRIAWQDPGLAHPAAPAEVR